MDEHDEQGTPIEVHIRSSGSGPSGSQGEPERLPVVSGPRSNDGALVAVMPDGPGSMALVGKGHPFFDIVVMNYVNTGGGRFLLLPPDAEPGQHVNGVVVDAQVARMDARSGTAQLVLRGVERAAVDVELSSDGEMVGRWTPLPDKFAPGLAEQVAKARKLVEDSPLEEELKAPLRKIKSDTEAAAYFATIALSGTLDDDAAVTAMTSDDPAVRMATALAAFDEAMERQVAENPDLEISAKLKQRDLPKTIRTRVNKEMSRLKQMDPRDPSRGNVEAWLRLVADLPWGQRVSPSTKSLREIREVFDGNHAGLEDVKKALTRQIDQARRFNEAIAKLPEAERSKVRGKRYGILLVGPPGTGKTTIGESYAEALDKTLVQINVGGVYSSGELNGSDRVFQGAHAGQIISRLAENGSPDIVLLLDEVDKVTSGGQNGDPFAVLLEVLDPSRNNQFTDRWLDLPFDISEIPVIVTANDLSLLPDRVREVLLDRLEVIQLEGYSPKQKFDIAHSHLLDRAYAAAVTTRERVQISDEALMHLIRDHTGQAGMRQLDRKLIDLFNAVETQLRDHAEAGEPEPPLPFVIDPAYVDEVLGDGITKNEMPVEWAEPGFGLWMYVQGTGSGGVGAGNVDKLETSKGELRLTGTVADAIKESAQAAYGWVAEHREALGIDEQEFQHDYQINFGDISTPKDGPSAGAMTTLILASKLMRVPIRSRFTMTGTIEPGGRVGKIGGVVAKIIGAHDAGVDTVLIPKANENDLKKLPEDIAASMNIIPVSRLEEAVEQAFPGRKFGFQTKSGASATILSVLPPGNCGPDAAGGIVNQREVA
jgi:ATP-dependent Lon protease